MIADGKNRALFSKELNRNKELWIKQFKFMTKVIFKSNVKIISVHL